MENVKVITIFDIEARKEKLRKELAEKGSVVMLHFKGNRYKVFAIVKHTETNEELVAYKCIHIPEGGTGDLDTFWVRPLDMFLSPTDLDKYPHCQFDYRFMFLDDAEREMYQLLNGEGNDGTI